MYNFSAGPAMLPHEVMQQAREEFLNWRQLGVSVMEVSHRSSEFEALAESARTLFRELLGIPDNYDILFLHGGAQAQFSAIPMNFTQGYGPASYIKTGTWSQIAGEEASRYAPITWVADSDPERVIRILDASSWELPTNSAYLYYADNETIQGVEFPVVPNSGDVPLIADMSSNLLSRPFDVSRFGAFFACAQKNLGIAGVTVVVVRKDLLERECMEHTPKVFNYALQARNGSMVNTPSAYAWYIMELVLQWVKRKGGVGVMQKHALERSSLLYDYIDSSEYYQNPVASASRSRMNVVFTLRESDQEDAFLKLAKEAGLVNLKGHRSVGGIRASIYNAMPIAGVNALLNFMQEFEESHRA